MMRGLYRRDFVTSVAEKERFRCKEVLPVQEVRLGER